MKNLIKKLGSIAATAALLLAFGGGTTYIALASATTLRVVQTPSIHLYAGISGSATSARVTPFPKDLDGTKLTMTDFGSNPTFTIDPKVSSYEEIVGFTGITDNGDNTATLTGLTRDLTSKYPYTTAGTGRTHGAGATVVFGNNPQIYGRLASLENDQTFTGTDIFGSTTMPHYDLAPSAAMWNAAAGTVFVSLDKLNAVAIAGAANSTETVNGISQLATGAQAALGTSAGSTGARLALPASLGTSTCQVAQNSVLIASSSNGKLGGGCLNTAYAYTFTGAETFGTATTTLNATTTIAASTSTAPLILNGVSYGFPTTQGASSTALMTDGVGNLSWEPSHQRFASSTLTATSTNGLSTSTLIGIPAGVMTASSTIEVSGYAECDYVSDTAACNFSLRKSTGEVLGTFSFGDGTTGNNYSTMSGIFRFLVLPNNSVSSQTTIQTNSITGTAAGTYAPVVHVGPTNGTSAINLSNAFTLVLVMQGTAAHTANLSNLSIIVQQ